MGEEEKKGEEMKEAKKPTEENKEKSEKQQGEEKKKGGGGGEKKSDDPPAGKDSTEAPPPPLPEIVLRVYMHCEGCARKVKKSLRGFNGVEDVITDCKTHTVVVKGEKADPLKVLERVQRKSRRNVELLSPVPKPPSEEEANKKPEEKVPPKPEVKDEPKVITVVLKVHMHCEACAQEIKKRIERMKEVEVATPDLKSSQVTVKGTFDPPKLVDYVYKRTGKHALIVKQDPETNKEDDKGNEKDGKEEKKGEEKKEGGGDGGDKAEKKGDAGKGKAEGGEGAAAAADEEETKVVELRRNEFYYYPPRYPMELYAYPPQIFSDENPNACSIM